MKKLFFAFVLFFYTQFVFGGNPFLVYFQPVAFDSTNLTLQVDVKVKDFNRVLGAQMYMYWDSSIYFFDTLINANSELNEFRFNNKIAFAENNYLAVQWAGVDPVTYPDDTTIFSVILKVIGQPCDSTTLKLIDISWVYKSLAVYDVAGNMFEESIRFEEEILSIPGENCDANTSGIISDNANNSKITIYPNPVMDILNIDFSGNLTGEYTIVFYNLAGREIYRDKILKQTNDFTYQYIIDDKIYDNFVFVKIIDPAKKEYLRKAMIMK